jgi:hypothetical protein
MFLGRYILDRLENDKSTIDISIPARITIGVTGHRQLSDLSGIRDSIQSVIEKLKTYLPHLKKTRFFFNILSPLAEGADRFIVDEIMKQPGTNLEAVLPLDKKDYIDDFQSVDSKVEFERLLSAATTIRVLPQKETREEAYEQVGHFIVDHCDLLIALWNGKRSEGRGGTQELVAYAREKGCPLIWINSENPSQIRYEMDRLLDQNYKGRSRADNA